MTQGAREMGGRNFKSDKLFREPNESELRCAEEFHEVMEKISQPTHGEILAKKVQHRVDALAAAKSRVYLSKVYKIEKLFANVFSDFNIAVSIDIDLLGEIQRFERMIISHLELIEEYIYEQNTGQVSKAYYKNEIESLKLELKVQQLRSVEEIKKYMYLYATFSDDKPLLHHQQKVFWSKHHLDVYLTEKITLLLRLIAEDCSRLIIVD